MSVTALIEPLFPRRRSTYTLLAATQLRRVVSLYQIQKVIESKVNLSKYPKVSSHGMPKKLIEHGKPLIQGKVLQIYK